MLKEKNENSEITKERNAEVIREMYNVIFNEMDIEDAEKLLARQGRICADTFAKKLPPQCFKDLDSFLNGASSLGKEKIEGMPNEIQRKRSVEIKGNTVYWTLDNDGKCICHLVRSGLIEPNSRLGICCANWVKRQLERFTTKPVRVELIDSPLIGGAKECKFKCTIMATEEAPVYSSESGRFTERHK